MQKITMHGALAACQYCKRYLHYHMRGDVYLDLTTRWLFVITYKVNRTVADYEDYDIFAVSTNHKLFKDTFDLEQDIEEHPDNYVYIGNITDPNFDHYELRRMTFAALEKKGLLGQYVFN